MILSNFYSSYCYLIIPAIVYQLRLPFTLSHYQLWFYNKLLPSLENTQHEVTA